MDVPDRVKDAQEVKNLLEGTDHVWNPVQIPERVTRTAPAKPRKSDSSRDPLKYHDENEAYNRQELGHKAAEFSHLELNEFKRELPRGYTDQKSAGSFAVRESRPETPTDLSFAVKAIGAPSPMPPPGSAPAAPSGGGQAYLAHPNPVGAYPAAAPAARPASLFATPAAALNKAGAKGKKGAAGKKGKKGKDGAQKKPAGTIDRLPAAVLGEVARSRGVALPGDTLDLAPTLRPYYSTAEPAVCLS